MAGEGEGREVNGVVPEKQPAKSKFKFSTLLGAALTKKI